MDYRMYQIAFSPELELTSEEFAVFWNAIPEFRFVAQADVSQSKNAQQFIDPLLVGAVVTLITNVTSSVLCDLIKEVIHKIQDKKGSTRPQSVHRRIRIEELNKPDGTHSLIVDIDES